MSHGVKRIKRERKRQLEEWSADHDDTHGDGELARAASYLAHPTGNPSDAPRWALGLKTKDRLRELEVAGALIAAEIDRLLRKL